MVSPTAVALCHVWLHGRILVPQWFCPCGQCHHQKGFKNIHIAAPVEVARQQTTPELSWTFRNTGTLRNPPEPSGSCLRNLPQHPFGTFQKLPPEPKPSRTFRKLPPEPTQAHTGTVQNLHQHTLEPSGTFRKLFPEPTPAHTRTLRNLPEPASGTYTSTHRNSPEPSGTFLRNLLLRPAPTHTGAYLGWRPHWLTLLGKKMYHIWESCVESHVFGQNVFWNLRWQHTRHPKNRLVAWSVWTRMMQAAEW